MQGVSQRFDTRKLYHDLHWLYFHKLAETMAVRAEIISNESRQMELNEVLLASAQAIDLRQKKLRNLIGNNRRRRYTRLRRSACE